MTDDEVSLRPRATREQKLRYLAGIEDLSTSINYGGLAKIATWLIQNGYTEHPHNNFCDAAKKALKLMGKS